MDTILGSLNPKFADRIPAYLQNCRQNGIAMLDALDRADFETVRYLGHQMRGSGGAFGFQAITEIGAELQQAAESSDTEASRKWVGELSRYLDRVETISSLTDSPHGDAPAATRSRTNQASRASYRPDSSE